MDRRYFCLLSLAPRLVSVCVSPTPHPTPLTDLATIRVSQGAIRPDKARHANSTMEKARRHDRR